MMKAFPQTCKWCGEKPFRKTGRIYLCKKHYRFQGMRVEAKRRKRDVLDYKDLERYLNISRMICPCCNRHMNWIANNGQSTVVTLQHNNDGTMNFLCRACNTLHGKIGDIIYHVHEDEKYCISCDSIKRKTEFYVDNSRPSGLKSCCKTCSNKRVAKHRKQNRDKYNEYQRQYRTRQ